MYGVISNYHLHIDIIVPLACILCTRNISPASLLTDRYSIHLDQDHNGSCCFCIYLHTPYYEYLDSVNAHTGVLLLYNLLFLSCYTLPCWPSGPGAFALNSNTLPFYIYVSQSIRMDNNIYY